MHMGIQYEYTVKTVVSSGHDFVPLRTLFAKKCPYWEKKCPENTTVFIG